MPIKLGVNSAGDVELSVSGTRKSLNGMGESASLSYSKNLKSGHSFDFSALKPFLGWQRQSSVGVSIYRNCQNLVWNKSELSENAAILTYNGSLLSEKLPYSARLNLAWRHFQPSVNSPFPIKEHAGHTSKLSLEHAITLVETRDRPILASSGAMVKLSQEYAGLFGGDSAFLRHQLDVQAAAPLFFEAFLGASMRATIVQGLADRSLHLLDRVYLGGTNDIRGFEANSIGNRSDSACLGGAVGCAAALHIYRPLVPKDMLFAHGFVTGGTVCSVRSKSWMRDIADTPRVSAGVGVAFVYANMIRLEVNYCLPLRYVPGDSCSSGIQLGVGVNFL